MRPALKTCSIALLVLAGCSTDPTVKWAFDPHQEEGVHANVEVEWWYHWGFLTDEAGNEWAAFSSFFRTWKKDLPLTRYFLYDLTDLKNGTRKQRSAAPCSPASIATVGISIRPFPTIISPMFPTKTIARSMPI